MKWAISILTREASSSHRFVIPNFSTTNLLIRTGVSIGTLIIEQREKERSLAPYLSKNGCIAMRAITSNKPN